MQPLNLHIFGALRLRGLSILLPAAPIPPAIVLGFQPPPVYNVCSPQLLTTNGRIYARLR